MRLHVVVIGWLALVVAALANVGWLARIVVDFDSSHRQVLLALAGFIVALWAAAWLIGVAVKALATIAGQQAQIAELQRRLDGR